MAILIVYSPVDPSFYFVRAGLFEKEILIDGDGQALEQARFFACYLLALVIGWPRP